MDDTLLCRLNDLSRACLQRGGPSAGFFFTPAEQQLFQSYRPDSRCELLFNGGDPYCERKVPILYPDYLDSEYLDFSDCISAVRITTRAETLSHREVLGSVLGSGIKREYVGDIRIFGGTAFIFMLPPAAKAITYMLEKISAYHASAEIIPLTDVPAPEIHVKSDTFTVQSIRFDAVLSGLFHISRTDAAEQIRLGNASLNYAVCQRPDAHIDAGSVISLRGYGKGTLAEIQGASKKGRIFIRTERYL